MWFGFGLITAVLAFVFAMRMRLQARWKGDARSHPGVPRVAFDYQEVRAKRKLTKARIGVSAPQGLHFRLRVEGRHDAFFKWLGVSEEMQTSDPAFDERLYLEADAIAIHIALREQPQLRAAILRIFDAAEMRDLKNVQLRCMSGRLWVEFKPGDEVAARGAQSPIVPELKAIADALQRSRLDPERSRDPFVWRAAALLAISTAMAVLGGLGLARGLAGRTDILEPWSLFTACTLVGLVFAAAFVLLILVILGRSSRTHTVLIEAAIVGTFGFITGTFALAREANIEFDTSVAERHELQGARAEHSISRGRRGRRNHHYYLHVPDWRGTHSAEYLEITIDSETFQRLEGKDTAIVVTRKGALGYEWIQLVTA